MLATYENNTEKRVYDSVHQLVEHALSTDSNSTKKRNRSWLKWDEHIGRRGFLGRRFDSNDELRIESNTAWPAGLAIVDSLLSELGDAALPQPKVRRRRTRFSDVDGAELDYDRLRSGQDFWRTTTKVDSTGPRSLTLSVDVGANAKRKPEEILWRGVTSIVITTLLETAGYQVELWLHTFASRVYHDGSNAFVAVCLKRLSDTLDTATLTNAISGWFFRTVLFAERMQSHCDRTPRNSLGYHTRVTQQQLSDHTHDENTVIVDDIWCRSDAIAFIRNVLADFAN